MVMMVVVANNSTVDSLEILVISSKSITRKTKKSKW